MTTTITPVDPAPPEAPPIPAPPPPPVAPKPVPAASPEPAGLVTPPAPRPGPFWARLSGTAFSILAAVLLGFIAQFTVLGDLGHDRAQKLAFANFRADLALATAPVNHVSEDGKTPLAEGTAVAVIEIPAIGVHEVVFEGTDSGVLTRGPGHRRDTVFPGQAGTSILMGRRAGYGGPFSRIGELAGGDRISVITGQGEQSYEVMGVRRAGDPQPAALVPGAGRLTLITADGTAYLPDNVLRVDAKLTSKVRDPSSLAVSTALLPPAEQMLGIDLIALVPLVLWGQLMFVSALAMAWVRQRLGLWHAWLIGLPVLTLLGLLVAGQVTRLLPNLI
ncbi:sortase [Actinoplanes sp. L3-i22]|uniref:sortase n=1 Tax=Actinoplanes sp. L3-i22 TaxID=2836373 RepID=UPI001C78756B|nr:class E sortase [Actinoplanes sp. L3-i22]BCY05880.1 sortase [Actinoplanes sp. L3-i22]